MEDLRKYYQEKRLHQENLGNIEENQMLQHTIDFAKMGVRGVFILNGTAAISLLTLFTYIILEEKYDIASGICWATMIFAGGAALACLSLLFAWTAQGKYQDAVYFGNQISLQNIELAYCLEDIAICENKMYDRTAIPSNVANFLTRAKEYSCKTKKTIDALRKDQKSAYNKGFFYQTVALVFCLFSFITFFVGIYQTYNTLENAMYSSNSKQEIEGVDTKQESDLSK